MKDSADSCATDSSFFSDLLSSSSFSAFSSLSCSCVCSRGSSLSYEKNSSDSSVFVVGSDALEADEGATDSLWVESSLVSLLVAA
jgi:hypothetical protein